MARKLVEDASLKSVADAIRLKAQTQSQLQFPNGFLWAIQSIQTGGGLPSGISAIKIGTHTVSSDAAYGTAVNISHNLGVVPDLFIVYATSNTAVTYSDLLMIRGTEIMYRGSSYHTLVVYRGNSTSSASATFANSSKGGIYGLTATTATIGGHASGYHIREGSYRWIAIKFS